MVDINAADIPTFRQRIVRNTRFIAELKSLISDLEKAITEETDANIVEGIKAYIANEQSFITELELQNTLANETIAQAEAYIAV